MGKIKVVMNKPVYLGHSILDLSKIVMYEFHYDYMKHKYNDKNLTLCYMDTSYRSQLMFSSSKHEVRTLEVNKLALSRDDDKRITING